MKSDLVPLAFIEQRQDRYWPALLAFGRAGFITQDSVWKFYNFIFGSSPSNLFPGAIVSPFQNPFRAYFCFFSKGGLARFPVGCRLFVSKELLSISDGSVSSSA